jgi:hypothetical protein
VVENESIGSLEITFGPQAFAVAGSEFMSSASREGPAFALF